MECVFLLNISYGISLPLASFSYRSLRFPSIVLVSHFLYHGNRLQFILKMFIFGIDLNQWQHKNINHLKKWFRHFGDSKCTPPKTSTADQWLVAIAIALRDRYDETLSKDLFMDSLKSASE
jgi:hypothetical protein